MTETEKIEGVRANSIEEIRGGVPLEISSYLSCAGSGTVVTIGPFRYLVHYCEEEPGRRSVAGYQPKMKRRALRRTSARAQATPASAKR